MWIPSINAVNNIIQKKPIVEKEEVKYWRKNWVLQNYMDSENCIDKPIDINFMEKFLKETNELFDLVLQRIQDETEHLYPLVRSLT